MSLPRLFATLPRQSVAAARPVRPVCTAAQSPSPPSSTSPPNSDKSHDLTLLHQAILRQIPTHGFTQAAIQAAIHDLKWSPASHAMLPRGPIEVVEQFSRHCDVSLARRLAQNPQPGDPVEPSMTKAAFAIRTRLEMIEPYHDHWAAAIKLRALPPNSPRAIRDSATLADEIAHYAGFTRPDVSWYTDRAVLGLAYHATELYWLTDKTEGREETWRFLDRRLLNSFQLRSGVSSAYNNLMTLSDATVASISTLVRSARRSY